MAITVTHIANPGASAIQGAPSMKGRASAIINPQSELGGCAPMPTKLSAAPSRIANVMRRLASTTIGGQAFGSGVGVGNGPLLGGAVGRVF